MNSVTNSLRNTFMSKIPSQEEISRTCRRLADKLSADGANKNDVKLALMDIIDEALQGQGKDQTRQEESKEGQDRVPIKYQ